MDLKEFPAFPVKETCDVLDLGQFSTIQNAMIGIGAGLTETVTTQPLVYWKNMAQQGKRLKLVNLRTLYRGLPVNCLNMSFTTMLQFPLMSWTSQLIRSGDVLQPHEEITSAAMGGMLSGPASSVFGLVMIQQQIKSGSIPQTIHLMQARFGWKILTRGMIPTMARESGFAMGYLGLSPVLAKYFNQKITNGTFWSSIISGVFAGLITHPFDTVKTVMQSNLGGKTFKKSFEDIYKMDGVDGFYRGFQYRTACIVCAFGVMGEVKERLPRLLSWVE